MSALSMPISFWCLSHYNSFLQDSLNGIFMGIEKQVDIICNMIKDDDNLKDGYNAIDHRV